MLYVVSQLLPKTVLHYCHIDPCPAINKKILIFGGWSCFSVVEFLLIIGRGCMWRKKVFLRGEKGYNGKGLKCSLSLMIFFFINC